MTNDERINKTIEIAARLMGDALRGDANHHPQVANSILYVAIAKAIISEAEKEAK